MPQKMLPSTLDCQTTLQNAFTVGLENLNLQSKRTNPSLRPRNVRAHIFRTILYIFVLSTLSIFSLKGGTVPGKLEMNHTSLSELPEPSKTTGNGPKIMFLKSTILHLKHKFSLTLSIPSKGFIHLGISFNDHNCSVSQRRINVLNN